MSDSRPGAGTGGEAAAEAIRLFEAVQDWARRTSVGDFAAHWADESASRAFATGAAECRLCPLCQLVAFLRHSHPEVVDHVADAMASLAAAVRAGLGAPEQDQAARPRGGGIERIDIG